MIDFAVLQKDCWQVAEDHGWHTKVDIVEKLCLIHSEISECLEEHRNGHEPTEIYLSENGKPEGVPVELADAIIRIMDLAEALNIDLETAVCMKQDYNRTRPFRHGGKVC